MEEEEGFRTVSHKGLPLTARVQSGSQILQVSELGVMGVYLVKDELQKKLSV